MTDDSGVAVGTEPASSGRPAGFVLGLGSIIMLAFMALHPTVHAHGAAGLASEMSRVAVRNAVVHGTLIANLGLMLLGLLGLADRLGLGRMLVRAGIIAAAMGTITLNGAALLNGFVTPSLVARYADAGASFDELHPVLLLAHECSVALVHAGIPALSAAVLALSIVLLGRGGASRLIGALGVICALLPVVAQASGNLPVDVHGFGAFVLVQSIWYMATAVQLIRKRI
jgi:hypothetical protein